MKNALLKRIAVLAVAVFMANCVPVTVNLFVSFPEQQIRDEAGAIEYRVRSGLLKEPEAVPDVETQPAPRGNSRAYPGFPGIRIQIAWGGTEAWAQGDSSIDFGRTSEIRDQLTASRIARATDVDRILTQGHVAEGRNGLLVLSQRFENLPDRIKTPVKEIVEKENTDRMGLYREIARLNNVKDEDIGRIQSIFASENQLYLKPGQQYEDPRGRLMAVTEDVYQRNLRTLRERGRDVPGGGTE